MTKYDDAQLNTENPLILKSDQYGGRTMKHWEHDDNHLNLMRSGGVWTQRLWLHNEICWHRGGAWHAKRDNSVEPRGGSDDWEPLVGPMGRGHMGINAANDRADIGAAWQTIDDYDNENLTSVGCQLTLLSGAFVFDYPGLWQISLSLSIAHNEAQSGRTTSVRLQNLTTGSSAGNPWIVGIGRNQAQTTIVINTLAPIAVETLGNQYVMQIGNGDTITGDGADPVRFTSQAFSVVQLHYS